MPGVDAFRWVRSLTPVGISLVLLLPFVAHIQGAIHLEVIQRLENYLYDARLQLTMPDTVDERIVILDIDEASLATVGHWPWPRDKLAGIVDTLFDDYGIAILAFDVVFPEREESSAVRLLESLRDSPVGDIPEFQREVDVLAPRFDTNKTFAESFIARDVVLGFVFKDTRRADEPEFTGTLPPALLSAAEVSSFAVPFIEAAGFVGNLAVLQDNATAGGFFDAPLLDGDGVYRRAPLVQRYRGNLYPSLALAVAYQATGRPAFSFEFAAGQADERSGLGLEAFRLGESRIAVDGQAAVLIPFRGRQGSFPYVSARHVVSGAAPPDLLAGKIVVMGASAAGVLDLRATPVGERYIGVEAHANLIAGLLDGAIRYRPAFSDGVEVVVLLALCLVTALWLPRLSPLAGLLLVVGLIAGMSLGNMWFWQAGVVIPLASGLVYTLLAALLQINYGYFVESRNKRRLSRLFGQYIPPQLVREMDVGGAELSLEGESRTMSVLFSDVRGFTSISERLDPRELTQLMNQFLTPITQVIHDQRGTIDKYMGDAVMAFWGAPFEDPQHSRHAVIAGLKMIETVRNLGAEFEARGWPPVMIGVGVASGEMNVGNMGSEFRMAYTVMGDVVNLGSRLEGLTKQYGVDMIVSEATATELPDIAFRELDLVRVKGKREPIAIFEPLCGKEALTSGIEMELEQFGEALRAYRACRWEDAASLLGDLIRINDQPLYGIYRQRVAQFRAEPPPEDWDGVFVHQTK